jgi:hypothetical protein
MDTITSASAKNSFAAAGWGGLGFIAMVLAENVLRGAPVPNNSELAAIVQYYTEKKSMLMISHSLYIITIPCLLIYAGGLFKLLKNESSDLWARMGWGAAIIMPVSFSLVVITDMALTSMAGSTQPHLAYSIPVLFKLHALAFIVNGAVLGTVMIGFGKAANGGGKISSWLSVLSIIGGLLLILSAVPAHLVLEGSMWGMVGLGGFLCWLIWVAFTSIYMLKVKA